MDSAYNASFQVVDFDAQVKVISSDRKSRLLRHASGAPPRLGLSLIRHALVRAWPRLTVRTSLLEVNICLISRLLFSPLQPILTTTNTHDKDFHQVMESF